MILAEKSIISPEGLPDSADSLYRFPPCSALKSLFSPPKRKNPQTKESGSGMPYFIHDNIDCRINPIPRGFSNERYTGRSSDFRINLLAVPSHPSGQWQLTAFVLGYSGGTVTDSHRLPLQLFRATRILIDNIPYAEIKICEMISTFDVCLAHFT